MTLQHLEILYIYEISLLMCMFAASLPFQEPSKFTLGSIMDVTVPILHPIVAAGSDRCESFKSFFGLTYEQMQAKNLTYITEILNIDLITKKGNVKYNLTATRRLNRIMDSANNVVILIHGFMESSDGLMVQAIAPEFLKQKNLKILALDGRKIINLEYFRSSTYARFMGEQLGVLLAEMIRRGQDPSKLYLIGHSLGAHIAGIAGKSVHNHTGELIGRITGLDPAGPCFSNINLDGKLDRGDAAYVDVIHTNGGMLGLLETVGHKDFFPNNGLSQPGCYLSTCDHSRAWELFAESINYPNHFPARKCTNWTRFRDGLCVKNEVAFMGINSESGSPGPYFFTTGSSTPFGLGPTGSG